jgi:hypothetical protein
MQQLNQSENNVKESKMKEVQDFNAERKASQIRAIRSRGDAFAKREGIRAVHDTREKPGTPYFNPMIAEAFYLPHFKYTFFVHYPSEKLRVRLYRYRGEYGYWELYDAGSKSRDNWRFHSVHPADVRVIYDADKPAIKLSEFETQRASIEMSEASRDVIVAQQYLSELTRRVLEHDPSLTTNLTTNFHTRGYAGLMEDLSPEAKYLISEAQRELSDAIKRVEELRE